MHGCIIPLITEVTGQNVFEKYISKAVISIQSKHNLMFMHIFFTMHYCFRL